MYRPALFFAILCATPLGAQWNVSAYTASTITPSSTLVYSAAVPLALNPASSVFITDGSHDIIWRVRAGGVVERFAGTGVSGFSGDGGPATVAQLYMPQYPQTDSTGNVYFLDTRNYRIRRIDIHGIITTVAGTGVPFAAGLDRDGPATSRSLGDAVPVAPAGTVLTPTAGFVLAGSGPPTGPFIVRSSGDVYFADGINNQYQVRRVKTAGQMDVIAGVLDGCLDCSEGDRGAATAAHLKQVRYMAFDGAGNLYIVEGSAAPHTIRRISPDGVITKFAGYGSAPEADGQPALTEYLGSINGLAVDVAGNVYVSNFPASPLSGSFFVRRIGLDGLVHTIAQFIALYGDPTGRVFYITGSTIIDAVDGKVVASVPAPPSPLTTRSEDGTPAHDAQIQVSRLAVNRKGELHFFEWCQIRKFDQNAILQTLAALPCESGNIFNLTMAFDTQDRLWVRDPGMMIPGPPGGTPTMLPASTYILSPDGQPPPAQNIPQNIRQGTEINIAVDAKGRLHVMGSAYLNRLESDGTVRAIVGPADNLVLRAIGNDAQGNVYFGVFQGGVYRVQDDGSITKFAGELPDGFSPHLDVDAAGRVWRGLGFRDSTGTYYPGLRGGSGGDGGPVQTARFGTIIDSVLAPDGTVYVEDGPRIRKLTPVGRTAAPVITSGGIVNSASYTGGSIAPGELISMFGSQFGPANGVQVGAVVNNILPSAVGRTKVLFGGLEGKISAATPNQINVFVPYGVTIGSLVDVVVLVDDAPSLPMGVPVAAQAFGLFTLDSSGSGQGAILNQDGSVNGPANPTHRGDLVSLFGTGEGLTFPALLDGALEISTPYSKPSAPVTVKINGILSEVLYAGSAPTLPTGAFQINVRIPLSLPRPGLPPPDPTVISVTVGSSTTTRSVTVTVQ